MKRILLSIMTVVFLLSFSGCGGSTETVQPPALPLEITFINETLQTIGEDYSANIRDYSTEDMVNLYYTVVNIKTDEIFGVLQTISGPERGNYTGIICDAKYGDTETVRKTVRAVCNLYGSPDGRKVAAQLEDSIKSGEGLNITENAGYEWKYELNGVHYSALFGYTVNFDGSETVSLVSFSAQDSLAVRFDERELNDPDGSIKKMERENREKYPLLYTTQDVEYPAQPSDEEIIGAMTENGLDIIARTAFTSSPNGTFTTQYTLWNGQRQEMGTAQVTNYVSGRRIHSRYNLIKADFNLEENAVEQAVKIACVLYGNPQDAEAIIPVVEDAVQNYVYNAENEKMQTYFEYNGKYVFVHFGFESTTDMKAGRAQFVGVSLSDTAVYSALQEYGMY